MDRALVTAEHVKKAHESGITEMAIPAGAIVTSLAHDTARDFGITFVTGGQAGQAGSAPEAVPDGNLEARVRAVLASVLSADSGSSSSEVPQPNPTRDRSKQVKLIKQADVSMEAFPFPGPGPDMCVKATDVVTGEDGSPMGAGFLSLTKGSFPWTFTYDEVQYVVEGELHLTTEEGVTIGKPGDVIFVPKGTKLTFGTPSWAKFLYVAHPANWSEGK